MTVEVLHGGLLATLQDRGRVGHAAIGVGRAGPMDDVSFRLANALVGNDDDAAAIEFALAGPRLRFHADAVVALAGAPFDAWLDGRPVPLWRPLAVAAGSVLDCGRARIGLHATLAIAGGFVAGRVLGSAATDLNAGLGPLAGRALRTGDRLERHGPARLRGVPPRLRWSLDPRPWFDADPARPIRLLDAPESARLDAGSRESLFSDAFRVDPRSNRVAFRLAGPLLRLAARHEAISEAVARGTVQLPPGGQPIVMMAEHPTTGGYPRIAQVAAIDLQRLAQRAPGAPLHFAPIGLDQAQTRYLAREHALARLLETIARRLADA